MPINPPLGLPTSLDFNRVPPGGAASARCGAVLHVAVAGPLSAQVQGADAALFRVSRLDSQELEFVDDPDAPRVAKLWVTVDSVDGGATLAVSPGMAVVPTVEFDCPVGRTRSSFAATLVLGAGAQSPPVMEFPLTASADPGSLALQCLAPELRISAGETITAGFRFTSTLAADVGGVLTCDAPGVPFDVDDLPAFPAIPAGATVDAQTTVTCAPGTSPGAYSVRFQLRQVGGPAVLASTDVPVRVVGDRRVQVSASLSDNVTLDHGSTTHVVLRFTMNGAPSTLSVDVAQPPHGLHVEGLPQSVAIDGAVFVGFDLVVGPTSDVGPLAGPLVLPWHVDGDAFHAAASGTLSFQVAVQRVSKTITANRPGAPIDFPRAGDVECTGATMTLWSDGAWEFSGSVHDHGILVGDRVSIAFMGLFTRTDPGGAQHGFVSRFVLMTLGAVAGPSRDYAWDATGTDAFLRENWPQVFDAGVAIHMEASSADGQLFDDLGRGLKSFFQSIARDLQFEQGGCLDPQNRPVDCSSGEPQGG